MSNERWVPSERFPEVAGEDLVLVEVLRALADPVRLRMVEVLADGDWHPCRVDEFGLDVHKSTLSHHFKVLREAGVTATGVAGREAAVRLRRETLQQRLPGLLDLLGTPPREH